MDTRSRCLNAWVRVRLRTDTPETTLGGGGVRPSYGSTLFPSSVFGSGIAESTYAVSLAGSRGSTDPNDNFWYSQTVPSRSSTIGSGGIPNWTLENAALALALSDYADSTPDPGPGIPPAPTPDVPPNIPPSLPPNLPPNVPPDLPPAPAPEPPPNVAALPYQPGSNAGAGWTWPWDAKASWNPARTVVLWASAGSKVYKSIANRIPDPVNDLLGDVPGGSFAGSLPNSGNPLGMLKSSLNQAGDFFGSTAQVGRNSIAAQDSTAMTLYQMAALPVADFTGVTNASYLYDNTNPVTGIRAGTAETWLRSGLGSVQLVGSVFGVKGVLPVKFGAAPSILAGTPAEAASTATLSVDAQVAKAQLLHQLRATGSRESLAAAALLKRGRINLSISSKTPVTSTGMRLGGQYLPGTRTIKLYGGGTASSQSAAGVLSHEAKHLVQRAGTTQNPYHRGLEFEAYKWQTRTDPAMGGWGDQEIWDFVNRHYGHIPGAPTNWKPNLGGQVK